MAGQTRTQGPVRTCKGCRARKPKRSLVRVAVNGEGQVVWDKKRNMPGRGAYLCPSRECLAAALKAGRLARSFRRPVSTDVIDSSKAPWEE